VKDGFGHGKNWPGQFDKQPRAQNKEMRVFYLIYENYDDRVIPFVEGVLKDCHLKEVGTVKSDEEDFRTVVHSWEKYPDWDWLKEMPSGKTARWAISGGFGEVPSQVCSGVIEKINRESGSGKGAARFQVCTAGVERVAFTPFNVPTFWELR
jgi:hypothetical protein